MDRFEEAMQKLAKMTEKERSWILNHYNNLCLCEGSYCGADPPVCYMYLKLNPPPFEGRVCCLRGKSSPGRVRTDDEMDEFEGIKKKCNCEYCKIAIGLTHQYFCIRGSEKQQRGSTSV